jgi:hypothetical protein
MSYTNIRSIHAKTTGFYKYTPKSNVWLIMIDSKIARPFVTATVDKGQDNNGYCDLSIDQKEGCSLNVPGNTEFLSEFIMLDGLSRDVERDITGTVHEVLTLYMAIGTVHSARIGKESF